MLKILRLFASIFFLLLLFCFVFVFIFLVCCCCFFVVVFCTCTFGKCSCFKNFVIYSKSLGSCDNVNNLWLKFKEIVKNIENKIIPHSRMKGGDKIKGRRRYH